MAIGGPAATNCLGFAGSILRPWVSTALGGFWAIPGSCAGGGRLEVTFMSPCHEVAVVNPMLQPSPNITISIHKLVLKQLCVYHIGHIGSRCFSLSKFDKPASLFRISYPSQDQLFVVKFHPMSKAYLLLSQCSRRVVQGLFARMPHLPFRPRLRGKKNRESVVTQFNCLPSRHCIPFLCMPQRYIQSDVCLESMDPNLPKVGQSMPKLSSEIVWDWDSASPLGWNCIGLAHCVVSSSVVVVVPC